MALLLAMYQKMRLIREKNQVTLDLTKYTSKLDRVQKNIEKVQKRYTSLFAQLEQQAKRMENDFAYSMRQGLGLGTNCVNINNLGGMNGIVYQGIYTMLMDTQNGGPGMSQDMVNRLMTEWQTHGKFREKVDTSVTPNKVIPGKFEVGDDITQLHIEQFMHAMRMSQQEVGRRQMLLQQGTTAAASNVSIWLEAQKEQLELEQDAALEPLTYQETMWELEKNSADMKLKRINANLESYEQLASQEAEKSAPTFGLR